MRFSSGINTKIGIVVLQDDESQLRRNKGSRFHFLLKLLNVPKLVIHFISHFSNHLNLHHDFKMFMFQINKCIKGTSIFNDFTKLIPFTNLNKTENTS